jgi:ubiquinone/menaquinone biosynthesis C-methylase UbiE
MGSNETRQYFDSVADQWDQMRRTFFGEGVRVAAIRAANISPGSIVADVGTGTGFIAEAALTAGARVIAIDSSTEMLAQMRTRYVNKPIELRAGDLDSLPLHNDEVDAVLANMVLHHAPDPAHAICEMARGLKPGGRLVITDADSHTHEWLRTEQHDLWLGFKRTDVATWFEQAGLVDVTVVDTDELCSPTAKCGTRAAITIFLARGYKPISV